MKDYNLDEALEIYKRTGSLHKTAKEMGTSHISLSHFFRDNGVPINNIGKKRDISDEEFESIVEDYTVNMLSMEKLSEKYHVRVRKLRAMFREKGVEISKWRGHVKRRFAENQGESQKRLLNCLMMRIGHALIADGELLIRKTSTDYISSISRMSIT